MITTNLDCGQERGKTDWDWPIRLISGTRFIFTGRAIICLLRSLIVTVVEADRPDTSSTLKHYIALVHPKMSSVPPTSSKISPWARLFISISPPSAPIQLSTLVTILNMHYELLSVNERKLVICTALSSLVIYLIFIIIFRSTFTPNQTIYCRPINVPYIYI